MANRKGRTFRKRNRSNNLKEDTIQTEELDIYELLRWMKKQGFGNKTKLKVFPFQDTGRGLKACQNFDANETIISIPESLILTCEIPQSCELYKDFLQTRSIAYFTEVELLSLFIAYEYLKGDKSKWWKYLSTLPKIQMTLSNITENQLEHLPKSYSLLVEKELKNIRNGFLKAKPFIAHVENADETLKGKLDYKTYHWSWNIVNSRCVSLLDHKKLDFCKNFEGSVINPKNTIALIPFLDLLNHSPISRISTMFNLSTRTFDIVTMQPIKKYSQVFINYGNHSNRKLLLHYGFFIPSNPDNVIPFTIEDLQCIESCHSNCMSMKINYSCQNLKNWDLTFEGLSWSLKATVQFLILKNCVKKVSKPNEALHKVFSSMTNIPEESQCQEYRNVVCQLLLLKIEESKLCVNLFESSNCYILKMLTQLIEEEIRIIENVKTLYEKC